MSLVSAYLLHDVRLRRDATAATGAAAVASAAAAMTSEDRCRVFEDIQVLRPLLDFIKQAFRGITTRLAQRIGTVVNGKPTNERSPGNIGYCHERALAGCLANRHHSHQYGQILLPNRVSKQTAKHERIVDLLTEAQIWNSLPPLRA